MAQNRGQGFIFTLENLRFHPNGSSLNGGFSDLLYDGLLDYGFTCPCSDTHVTMALSSHAACCLPSQVAGRHWLGRNCRADGNAFKSSHALVQTLCHAKL